MIGSFTSSKNFTITAPGANTNILTTSLTPRMDGVMRLTIVLATASVFNVTITNGSTTYTCGLNASTSLNAGDLYFFSFGVSSLNTYNFQVETNGVINILQVEECYMGVG